MVVTSDIKDTVVSETKTTNIKKETRIELDKIALLEKKLQKEYMKKISSKIRSR